MDNILSAIAKAILFLVVLVENAWGKYFGVNVALYVPQKKCEFFGHYGAYM